MDLEIRPMLPEDEPRAVEVSLAADTVFADAGGTVAGLAALLTVDGTAHLERLAVHPGHGRHGIGSALLEAVCAGARGRRPHPSHAHHFP